MKAIIKTAKHYGYDLRVLQAVEDVNDHQKYVLSNKIKSHFGEDLSGMTFALWGLSIKPNINDMSEAPAAVIINELRTAGATVRAYDPIATDEAREHYCWIR